MSRDTSIKIQTLANNRSQSADVLPLQSTKATLAQGTPYCDLGDFWRSARSLQCRRQYQENELCVLNTAQSTMHVEQGCAVTPMGTNNATTSGHWVSLIATIVSVLPSITTAPCYHEPEHHVTKRHRSLVDVIPREIELCSSAISYASPSCRLSQRTHPTS